LVPSTAANPPSKLFYILEENQDDINANLVTVDRRYFAESTGLEAINQLAFAEDVEAIKISIGGNYFAVCCFAAVRFMVAFVIRRLMCAGSQVHRAPDGQDFPVKLSPREIRTL
jgi:DNA mismatch repair protein MSH4